MEENRIETLSFFIIAVEKIRRLTGRNDLTELPREIATKWKTGPGFYVCQLVRHQQKLFPVWKTWSKISLYAAGDKGVDNEGFLVKDDLGFQLKMNAELGPLKWQIYVLDYLSWFTKVYQSGISSGGGDEAETGREKSPHREENTSCPAGPTRKKSLQYRAHRIEGPHGHQRSQD